MNIEEFVGKNEKYILLAVLLLFTVLRLPYLLQESVWSDEAVYIWMGQKVLQDPGFILTSTPAHMAYGYLFSILGALLNTLFSALHSARILTLLFSVITAASTYYVLRKITNVYAAMLGAAFLGFNALHIFLTNRALLDVPLTCMFSLLLAAFVRFRPDDVRGGLIIGLISTLTIFTKSSGLLVIPIALISLIAMYPDAGLLKKRGMQIAIAGILISGAITAANNYFHFGRFTSEEASAFAASYIFSGTPTHYIQNSGFIYTVPIFLLALIGAYLSFGEKRLRGASVLFFTLFLFFSFIIGEKVNRYVLPTVPAAIILAVYSLVWIFKKLKIPNYLVLAVVLLPLLSVPQSLALLESKSTSYTGFDELGKSVAQLDSVYNFDVIHAQSARQIRAFSGIDYVSDGGKIKWLPENLENMSRGNVLLQVDIWEYAAPEWVYPLSQEKLNTIFEHNFTVINVVERDYPTPDGVQKVPVGLLLVKQSLR